MGRVFNAVIALVSGRCLACRGRGYLTLRPGFCGRCWDSVKRIQPPLCRHCGLPLPDPAARCDFCRGPDRGTLKKIRSVGLYEGSLRTAIQQFKYRGKKRLAPALAELLIETAREDRNFKNCRYVVPVPMHPRQERQRGYNPPEVLARKLCATTGQTLETRWLKAAPGRRSQMGLSRKERFQNAAGAFRTKASRRAPPGSVLLIDDVCTTGATLEECAKALAAFGCRRIFALTVARDTTTRWT